MASLSKAASKIGKKTARPSPLVPLEQAPAETSGGGGDYLPTALTMNNSVSPVPAGPTFNRPANVITEEAPEDTRPPAANLGAIIAEWGEQPHEAENIQQRETGVGFGVNASGEREMLKAPDAAHTFFSPVITSGNMDAPLGEGNMTPLRPGRVRWDEAHNPERNTGTQFANLFSGNDTAQPVDISDRQGLVDNMSEASRTMGTPSNPIINPAPGLEDVLALNTLIGGIRSTPAEQNAEFSFKVGDNIYTNEDLDNAALGWRTSSGDVIPDVTAQNASNGMGELPFSATWDDMMTAEPVYIMPDGNITVEQDFVLEEDGGNLSRDNLEQINRGVANMGTVDPAAPWAQIAEGQFPDEILPWATDLALNSAPYFIRGYNYASAASRMAPAQRGLDPDTFDPQFYDYDQRDLTNAQWVGETATPALDVLMEKLGGVRPGGGLAKSLQNLPLPARVLGAGIQEGLEEPASSFAEMLAQDSLENYGINRVWNPETEEFEYTPTTDEERAKNILGNAAEGFGGGAVFGLGLRGGQEAGSSVLKKINRKNDRMTPTPPSNMGSTSSLPPEMLEGLDILQRHYNE